MKTQQTNSYVATTISGRVNGVLIFASNLKDARKKAEEMNVAKIAGTSYYTIRRSWNGGVMGSQAGW